MKKNKLLVIFFLSCLFSYIIYNYTISNRINVLILGDNYLINSNYKTYDKYLLDKYYNLNDLNKLFTSENITYKDIIKNIKDNYYVYSKDKKVYLNLYVKSVKNWRDKEKYLKELGFYDIDDEL